MTVLVAVADDSVSAQVLDVAARLGRALEEELYVVHLTDETAANADRRAVRDDLQAAVADRDIEASVAIEHVSHSGMRTGRAVGQQLVDIASDTDITHAVIGHQSKGLLERLREGNTAFTVADAATVPVTVVPDSV